MKHKKWFVIALILVAGVILGSATAQEMKKHVEIITDGTHGCGTSCCGMKLDEEQQTKFKDLDLKLDQALLPLKTDLKVLDAELDKLLIADKPDKAAIDKKIDEIGAVKVKIEKARIKNRLAKRALLTEEQRVHFDKCGCMGGEMNIEKQMMFLGDCAGEGEKKIIIKRFGDDDEPMIWHDKEGDMKVKIKKLIEEEEEEE